MHVYEFLFLLGFEICRYLFKSTGLNPHSLFSNKSSVLSDNTLDLSKIQDVFSLCNSLLLKFSGFIKRNIVTIFTFIYYYYYYYFNNSEMQIRRWLVEILA